MREGRGGEGREGREGRGGEGGGVNLQWTGLTFVSAFLKNFKIKQANRRVAGTAG